MASGLKQTEKKDNKPVPKKVTPEQQFPPEKPEVKAEVIDTKLEIQPSATIPIENRTDLSQDDIDEVKPVEQEIIPTEQVMTQTVTVIQNQTIQPIPQKEFTELEKGYLNRLDSVRHKIDNPTPINRINKRRKYTEEKRRNVTFSILEDLCIILDDVVDDAKIYKGKFQDEIMIRGLIDWIKDNGIN